MEFPQIPRLSPADEIQARRALRSNRLLATGLLALMIVIAITTRFVPSPGWLVQLVRAGAEAGIIGGLADWFAITVLFRHPFGMPLPHTAILPSNKDRMDARLVPSSSVIFSFRRSFFRKCIKRISRER